MKRPERRIIRGSGLATVLVVTTLILTCAFTVVGISYNHLSITGRSNTVQQAHNLAEAAMSRAIANVLANPSFGSTTGAANYTMVVNFPYAPDGSFGVATFDPTVTSVNGISVPTSFNNLGTGDSPQTVNGVVIPADSFHVAGVGYCNGAIKSIDAVIYIPKFPYALGTSGVVQSGGGLVVAALGNGADPTNVANYLPGSLLSNNLAATAIDFAGASNVTIYGDAQSAGGAVMGNATVKGETRTGAAQQTLPNVSITSYNPSSQPNVQTLSGAAPSGALVGYNQATGPTTFPNGINLNNGVLYVNGDLTINGGGINGTGAIIATGNVSISGSGSLISDNQVGLLSGGNMSINGQTSGPQTVKGTVYSNGAIAAGNASLFGAVISNSATGNGGINVTNTNVFYNAQTATQNFTVIPNNVSVPGVGAGRQLGVVQDDGGAPQPPNLTDVPISITIADARANPSRWLDSGTGNYVFPFTSSPSAPLYDPNAPTSPPPPQLPPGTYISVIDQTKPTGFAFQPYSGNVAPVAAADLNVTVNQTTYAATDPNALVNIQAQFQNSITAQWTSLTPAQVSNLPNLLNVLIPVWYGPSGIVATMQTQPYSYTSSPSVLPVGSCGPMSMNAALFGQSMDVSHGNPPTAPSIFNLDLSNDQVLAQNQQMRVLYWKDDL